VPEVVKYIVPIALGHLIGVIIKRRPPQPLLTAVVVALAFFVSANAAGVVLGNLAAFFLTSLLYAKALVVVTATWAHLWTKAAPGARRGGPLSPSTWRRRLR